jgi:hypothetical protein
MTGTFFVILVFEDMLINHIAYDLMQILISCMKSLIALFHESPKVKKQYT